MKIQVLEYFITIAELGSISEAAERLYVAQSSLSRSIQAFEREINAQLFYRTERGVVLTEEGKVVLQDAREILFRYNRWKSLTQNDVPQQIDIYVHKSFPDFLLPNIILQIRKRYPELTIKYEICSHPEKRISHDIEKPVLAFFSCSGEEKMQKYIRQQGNPPLTLLHGQYCCLVNADSPLTRKGDKISVKELRELYYVSPNYESIGPDGYSVLGFEDMLTPSHTINVETVENVLELLHQDPETYALSYYPALRRYKYVEQGELVPILFAEQGPDAPLCLFYSKKAYQKYPAVRELVQGVDVAAKHFLRCNTDKIAPESIGE